MLPWHLHSGLWEQHRNDANVWLYTGTKTMAAHLHSYSLYCSQWSPLHTSILCSPLLLVCRCRDVVVDLHDHAIIADRGGEPHTHSVSVVYLVVSCLLSGMTPGDHFPKLVVGVVSQQGLADTSKLTCAISQTWRDCSCG